MNKQKKYWLGYEEPMEQDEYFIAALDKNIWSAGTKKDWDTCWVTEMPDSYQFEYLDKTKTINHIPGNSALTIKSNLYTTLHKAKKAVEGYPQAERYDFFPTTFSMPEEYFDLQEIAAKQPDWMWIQKPRNLSRGRGIEMVQHLETVPLDSEWIIQRYLDKPHLWDGYKYVLRCYVLVTSVEPLRFYWYHEGSAKLTSAKFDLDDLDNPYRHLTNPDINENNDDAEASVTFHSFEYYKKWLQAQDIDDKKLFADIEDMLALTILAAREKMRDQLQNFETDTQGTYELIGIDCMIDSDIKPWIVECNLSPSLEVCSTNEDQAKQEIKTKKGMVTEIVNMLGLNDLDHDTLSLQQKVDKEMQRADGFQCIFPSSSANQYLNCFPVPRFADINSLPSDFKINYAHLPLISRTDTEAVFEDSLALLAQDSIRKTSVYITPNELATWIWIQVSSGKKPQEIADELAEAFGPVPEEHVENDDANSAPQSWLSQVWEMLADWSQAGLFSQSDINHIYDTDQHNKNTKKWLKPGYINLAGCSIEIHCTCPIAEKYIQKFSHQSPQFPNNTYQVNIFRSNCGYVITQDTQVISGSRTLSRLLDDCIKLISKHVLKTDDIALLHGAVISNNHQNGIIIGNREQLDSLAYELCLTDIDNNYSIKSGSCIISAQTNVVKCTDLPLLLPSNTDTISSSYDSSNYYPRKPQQFKQNNPESKIVKNDWIISEIVSQPCWLAPANGVVEELSQIKVMIFVEKTEEKVDNASIQPLNSADLLAKLWNSCSQKKTATAEQLPGWLKGIQGYKLECQDLNQARTMLAEIGNLLSK